MEEFLFPKPLSHRPTLSFDLSNLLGPAEQEANHSSTFPIQVECGNGSMKFVVVDPWSALNLVLL
jgi:hypothetical protein